MQLNLRVKDGGWGEGPLADIAMIGTLARAVIGAFAPGLPSECRFDILLEQNEQPRAVSELSDRGEFVIHVDGPGSDWFKFTFELGHEFTHVMAGPLDWELDRFAWFEECLADAGSLFALRGLAASWRDQPSRPDWEVNHTNFERYSAKYLDEPGRSLSEGADFKQWLAETLPSLEAMHDNRERNTIVARHLLPVFEGDPTAWRAIRYLHGFERPEGMTFAEFLNSWREACPTESQSTVDSIAETRGVSYPAPRPRLRRQPTTALQYLAAIGSAVSKPRPTAAQIPTSATSPLKTKRPDSSTD